MQVNASVTIDQGGRKEGREGRGLFKRSGERKMKKKDLLFAMKSKIWVVLIRLRGPDHGLSLFLFFPTAPFPRYSVFPPSTPNPFPPSLTTCTTKHHKESCQQHSQDLFFFINRSLVLFLFFFSFFFVMQLRSFSFEPPDSHFDMIYIFDFLFFR